MDKKTERRLGVAFVCIFALLTIEFIALTATNAQWLSEHEHIRRYVSGVRSLIPMVESFSRCSGAASSGAALMLALDVSFLPIKAFLLWAVRPHFANNPDTGFNRLARNSAGFLFGLLALVPVYVWFNLEPSGSGLASLQGRMDALCVGGSSAFFTVLRYGSFAVLGAYVACLVFGYLAFNFFVRTKQILPLIRR